MSDLQPRISTGRRFNPVWVVPVVAIVVGLYMVIHTKLTEGPEITIQFNTAEGMEAGKTKIRYRDVDIGLVENVSLSDNMDKVLVTAKMDSDAADMLRDDTRFWVVRARVGAGAVSGLGTLLSGAYIQLDPGAGKSYRKAQFIGLEVPPLTPADAPGVRLTLYSERAGSLNAGDAILYNGYKVGRIEGVTFDTDKKEMRYDAFIDAPYNDLVTTNTRFWNVSGVSIDASAAGIRVTTGSMETILLGGVAFGNLPGMPPGDKAVSGTVYKLNASYQALQEDPYRYGIYYVAEFEQSMRGLERGAPVEYRGIRIGRVERILIKELVTQREAGAGKPIPVLLYLEPARFGLEDSEQSVDAMRQSIALGVTTGMRATLQTGSLLTGALYINIDWYKDAPAAKADEFDGYPVIPTIPSGLGRLEQQVGSLLDKLNALPLEPLVASAHTALSTLDGTLASLTTTLESLDNILREEGSKALPGELNQTLVELRKALAGLSPDSAVGQSLGNSVFELNRTLRNLEELTRTLSEQPNSLVFPTTLPADPIPEASPQ
ncbi:MAG: intermembrane transport protein PqiB [Halioglobus sp.]|nr:intermembrane transport protein PqiB [Halioglobus sp.]MCB1707848.1 intermembrane transport protein PqiB [Halioglobus sp.]MCP5122084.1 intermembrane transport protein PqiB [Pseudomonadales bacterium]MCP5192370.1 intermembrane transport protein PqiB [Pseudomonadales bacterium]